MDGLSSNDAARHMDITERGQAEDVQARLAAIVENSDDAIFAKSLDGTILTWNAGAQALYGFSPKEAIGQSVELLVPPDRRAELIEILEHLRSGQAVSHLETVRRRKDGTEVLVSVSISVLRDAEGRPVGASSIARDVTERRQAGEVQARLAAIVEGSADAIFAKSLDGTILTWNAGAQALFGYTPAEVIGRSVELLVPPEQRAELSAIFDRLKSGEATSHHETLRRRKDGTEVVVDLSISPLRAVDGRLVGASTIARDVTERRRAEEARQQLDRRFRLMVEHSADGIALFTADGTYSYVSPSAERIHGRRQEELLGHHGHEHVHLDDVPNLAEVAGREGAEPGSVYRLEFRYELPDGSFQWIESSNVNRLDEVGISAVVATFRDVTERRRLEEGQRRSEERFRTIFRASPAAMGITSGGTILDVNDCFCEFFGYQRDELIGRTIQELGLWVDPSDRARMLASFRAQGEVHNFEARFRRKDGTIRDAVMIVEPVELAQDGEPTLLFMLADVTDRKRAEERLRESEERYRVLFDASPMSMWAFDPESLRIVMANQAAAKQYGYTKDELLALALPDLRPVEDAEKVRAAVRAAPLGRHYDGTWKHRRKDGSLLDVDVHANDVRLGGRRLRLAVLHDVTQRRSLEEQLRQSQKMEAVGRLAGGVAHDFNNLLTAILGYSDILANRFHAGDPEAAEIQEIRRAGERAAVLTRQLLAFSRKQVLVPEALDLDKVARGLLQLLGRLIGEDIKVSLVVAPDLGRVLADPGQMEQVVMNLAVNARDAMPRGGELLVEIKNVDVDDAFAKEHVGVTPGPYVLLAVTDTGVGMAPEVQKQIFEPFFTTKPIGEGTGLGLSTVYGIVNQSGGTIWVDSEPGRGTTFKIYLPRITGAAAAPQMASGIFRALEGSGTILLVEDDEQLRQLAKRILKLSGYTVLEARNSADALLVAREHDGPIALLLTDVVMPGMSGSELAASLLSERPGVPVLYMSGYTDDAIVHHGVLNPGTQFIQKPFTPNRLVQRVREVIGGIR